MNSIFVTRGSSDAIPIWFVTAINWPEVRGRLDAGARAFAEAAGFEPKAGRHFTFATPDRSGFEFAQVIFQLALRYTDAKKIHLVLDNLNIHRRKSLTDALGAEIGAEVWSRFTIHYTPRHGSWLNQAEIEIGLFARQCLGKRRMPNLKYLQRESKAWNRRMNRDKVTIDWRFTRKKARETFRYHRNSFTRS